jgi:hypothetical protein
MNFRLNLLKEILLYQEQFFKMNEIFDHFFIKYFLEKSFKNVYFFYEEFKFLRKIHFISYSSKGFLLNPRIFVLKKKSNLVIKYRHDQMKMASGFFKNLLKIKEIDLKKLILKEQKITLANLKEIDWTEEELKKVREKFTFYLKNEF